jgi:hypothetical protein
MYALNVHHYKILYLMVLKAINVHSTHSLQLKKELNIMSCLFLPYLLELEKLEPMSVGQLPDIS